MGTSLTMPRYSKSLSTLNGMLRTRVGMVAMPMWCSSSVWPSAVALATLLAPMEPPAPAALSTTMLTPPSGLRMASARSRATRSVGPPAVKGTTMVMGRSPGKAACAWAPMVKAARPAAAMALSVLFMGTPAANGNHRRCGDRPCHWGNDVPGSPAPRSSPVAARVLDDLAVVGQAAGLHELDLAAQLGDVTDGLA